MGKWSGRVARKVYKKCHKRHGFYYRFWKLRVFSYMLVSWSVVEMKLRVEEEKWSVGFFSKSVSYCTENTGDEYKYFRLNSCTFVYLYCRKPRFYFDLSCILTPPTDPPKYRTTRKDTPQYCTPKRLLKYIDLRFIIYQQQQQQQYNQSSVWLANDVLI